MMPSLLSSFSRSSLIGLHVVGLLGAWVSAVEDVVGSTYSLTTVYEGVDFFDNFDFLTVSAFFGNDIVAHSLTDVF